MRARWSEKLFLIVSWLWIGAACLETAPGVAGEALSPTSAAAYPTIKCVEFERAYWAAGEVARGVVKFDLPPRLLPGAGLHVVVTRRIDVAGGGRETPWRRSEELIFNRPITAETAEAPFAVNLGDMLFGTVQVEAELVAGGVPVSAAASRAATVGFRKRLDLAGSWDVAGMEILPGEMPRRSKDWKPAALPARIVQPGRLPSDEGFRGWVTLKRMIAWDASGDLQPRGIGIWGASDSARVRIDGMEVGETSPLEDMAVLTHWLEFHCPFKGPENERKRLLMIAEGGEFPHWLPLPKPLPVAGKAEVEMTIRAASGGVLGLPVPPYGILKEIYLDLLPPVYVKSLTMDTEKTGEKRRFLFTLTVENTTGRLLQGSIRALYGRYLGELPYTGDCPATAVSDQAVSLPAGESQVRVIREETPRFDTCRGTFLLVGPGEKLLDAIQQDFHTMVVEIRDRRDLYLNNERFFVKGQGSGDEPNCRLQLRIKGGNAYRGHRSGPSWRVPGLWSEAANIDDRYRDHVLTSAGSALLASCEKCIFWNPKDTSNITKAAKQWTRKLAQCPGLIEWEVTNELHGEPEEARVAILEAFHKYDPYHRPVLATKGSGEWEAEARDGRVAGVDIVGCQYLVSHEGVDSITAAVTQQPIMSTETNWFDMTLFNEMRMYEYWLNKGVCGSLLFDYSGRSLAQPVPLVPPEDHDQGPPFFLIRAASRALYQDMVATAVKRADGRVLLTVGNRMPYSLRDIVLAVRQSGRFKRSELRSGDAMTILMPAAESPPVRERISIRAEYTTHGGLQNVILLSPAVAAPSATGAK